MCNSYRPPRGNITDDSLLPFVEDINNILSELNKSKSIIALLGDFNINLLQYNNSSAVRDYLNNIISHGLYPKITLPTRLTDHSATLIDNIFYNCYNDNSLSSGILLSDLSDHFPYFCVLNEDRDYQKNTQRTVYRRNFNDELKHNLYDSLKQCNILNYLSNDLNADPNVNYNILEELIPLRKYKIHRHKNKKSEWITF